MEKLQPCWLNKSSIKYTTKNLQKQIKIKKLSAARTLQGLKHVKLCATAKQARQMLCRPWAYEAYQGRPYHQKVLQKC